MTDDNLLSYALENGIIDINTIRENFEMNERKRYIEQHQSKVWKDEKTNKWFTYVPDSRASKGRKLIKRSSYGDLEDAIVEYYKNVEDDPYIERVFDEWITEKLNYGEIQRQTYDRYKADYKKYIAYSQLESTKFRYITENMLEAFIKGTIHSKGLTAKAWGNLRTLLIGMFKYGKKQGYTNIVIKIFLAELDIAPKIFAKKVKIDEECVFTDEEIRMILNYMRQPKKPENVIVDLGVQFAMETGLRVGELSALEWSDIKEDCVRISKTEISYLGETGRRLYEVRDTPKTEAGNRNVFLTTRAKAILEEIREITGNEQYMFVRDGKRVHTLYFSRRLSNICKRLGITVRSIHTLRKTYGTKLINGNVNESVIINQMGHTDITTTKKFYYYNNATNEEMKKQVLCALEKV